MKTKWVIEIISALLIVIFVYAAASKLLNIPLFAAQLETHPYLKQFSDLLAWLVPGLEILISVLLILPITRKSGLYASAVLLIIFTMYLGLMLLSGKQLPCSCGGFISILDWKQHVVFNLALILFAIIGIHLYGNKKSYYKISKKKKEPIKAVWTGTVSDCETRDKK